MGRSSLCTAGPHEFLMLVAGISLRSVEVCRVTPVHIPAQGFNTGPRDRRVGSQGPQPALCIISHYTDVLRVHRALPSCVHSLPGFLCPSCSLLYFNTPGAPQSACTQGISTNERSPPRSQLFRRGSPRTENPAFLILRL